jgi:hypothetical protein
MTKDEVINKIVTDLAWRGPSGRPMNFVCLTREQAIVLIKPEPEKETSK